MKNTITGFLRIAFLALLIAVVSGVAPAQNSLSAPGGGNSLPAPGSGGSYRPSPPVGPPNGIGWNPGPGWNNGFGPAWNAGPGWNNGWYNSPTIVVNPVYQNPNQGLEKVIACGYDAQGVWRVLPLLVSYQYNGIQYDVTVINAWNPWTDSWDRGVDMPAYNTSYYLRGVNYDFYTPLSTGTYYFNL